MAILQEGYAELQEFSPQTKGAMESELGQAASREDEFNLTFLKIRKIFTLIFIHDIEHNQLLLGQKQRGALLGQWNGFGGKVECGLESIAESAARELKEEAFIKAPLFPIGFIQWVVSRSKDNEDNGDNDDDKTVYPYRDVMVVYKAHSLEKISNSGSGSDSSQTPATTQAPIRITEFEPSDEMAPAWWDIDCLPWESMRINHKVWYPFMLADRPYRGVYWYQTKRVNVTTDQEGSTKKSNAQRENAQEVWVEDLEKRCFQFGTQPIGERSLGSDNTNVLEDFADRLGVSGKCYTSAKDKVEQEDKVEERQQSRYEPTADQFIDEKWLLSAIARAENEWTSLL
ncbi:hypothetical protein BGZ49_000729 [Haplosporangium sp. Z 27]|nr:hypothetical protein BGZ49_000729 [Haplosporangium sp. Z 27]